MIIDAPDAIIHDLRGLNCPLPALRTLKALRAIAPGATLIVECTDPMAAIDVPGIASVSRTGMSSKARAATAAS